MLTVIDLFAGLGGSTEGARQAGLRVLWAGNHSLPACECHKANHPETETECQDLQQADWSHVPKHDLLLASPSCTGHTHARGRERRKHRARYDAARSTAWAVVSCLERHRTKYGIVENVPAFLDWELYHAWEAALRALGYSVAPHIVDSADHGVPQNRVRAIILLTRSKAPLWLKLPKRQHVPVSSILDRSRPLSPVRNMCEATRLRVRAGRREFGDRFIIPYYGSGSGLTGRSVDRPVGTITTVDRWALVEGSRMRMFSVNECRQAMGFPASYILPAKSRLAKFMLGNAVCPPVMRDVIYALIKAA